MRPSEFGQSDRDRGERSSVVPVGPVVPVKAPRTLPLVVIVAILVGTAAFVAGLQLGTARPADTTRPDVSPSAAASVAVAASPSSSTEPSPTEAATAGPPYASEFATTFEPPGLFAGFVGGKGCVSHIEQTEEAIGIIEYILVRSWTTFCPLQATGRASFVTDLSEAIAQEVPVSNGWTLSTADDGSVLALYPYTDSGFVGTVTMSADNAGSGFEILISLQERRAP